MLILLVQFTHVLFYLPYKNVINYDSSAVDLH